MVEITGMNTKNNDAFAPIAGFYDTMMEHVNYERWRRVATSLATLLPRPLWHLDVGCGTGLLMKALDAPDWIGAGLDVSAAMLRVAREKRQCTRLVQATMCRPPFYKQFHLVTCLFDSLNFLLEEDQVAEALNGMSDALKTGGLMYFDVVTARMVKDHFNNETWTETHDNFRSTWNSRYDVTSRICTTRVRINSGTESVTHERIYPLHFLGEAAAKAGLTVLAVRDANNWKAPGYRTTRVDFVAVKGDARPYRQAFKKVEAAIKGHAR